MSSQSSEWWVDDLQEVCVQFQVDLSCLVDGELDEVPAAHAIAHLEECSACRSFFEDARAQVRAHRELADSDGLIERYAVLLGSAAGQNVEATELVHRLATIFYQLGKAYVLTAVDPGFKTRVFEKAVQVASAQSKGRGFVDGVLAAGRGACSGFDWAEARGMLNGRLERIEGPLAKGRRLLEAAIGADPTHEEARLYLAWLDAHEGKKIRAANAFRQIFRTAIDDANRGHALVQLGKLLAEEGEFKQAIACNRWLTISGLADRDSRFFFARFNVGMHYAHLRDPARSVAAFRALLDRNPDRVPEIADLFMRSPRLRAVIDHQPGFAEALLQACPELFAPPPDGNAEENDGGPSAEESFQ